LVRPIAQSAVKSGCCANHTAARHLDLGFSLQLLQGTPDVQPHGGLASVGIATA
jgi:hypothetical protein